MRTKLSKLIPMLAIIAILGIALASWSFADEQDKDEQSITGTITLNNHTESEYPELASITLVQAIESGLTQVGGKALKAELQDEDGFLVYSIEVVKSDHSMVELVIDAGSGKLLLTEKDSKDNDGKGDDDDNDDEDDD